MVHRFLIVALLVALAGAAVGSAPAGAQEGPGAADRPPERVVTYRVLGRGGPVTDLEQFARHVALTLEHPRGWSLGGSIEFRRAVVDDAAADVDVVLAAADAMSSFGEPCGAEWSCRAGRHVAINEDRWLGATPTWPYDLGAYRHYVVNHEMGHWLGLDHRPCLGGPDDAAPIMAQLSKGPGQTGEGAAGDCRFEIWPTLGELAEAAEATGVELGPVPVDPRSATLGELETVEQVETADPGADRAAGTVVQLTGWAADPDSTSPRAVVVSVDGETVTLVSATGPRPDLARVPGSATTVGFAATVTLPARSNAHRLCVHAVGTGPGAASSPLGCRSIEVTPDPAASGVRQRGFDTAVRLGAAALGEARSPGLRRWLA